MTSDPDALYRDVWPEYAETQRKDLWFYERLWSVLLRQLEKRTRVQRTLVEFGSGPGFLLALANRRRSWFVYGVEPSEVARRHAWAMGELSFERMPLLQTRDAAIATEVLEHVEDPVKTLREWRDALVPGGYIALSVPNDGNPLQRLFGKWISPDRKTPSHWIHPTHLHYFNRHTLRAALESAGFEVVWERTSFPVELLLAIPLLPRRWAWKLSRIWPAPPLLWRWRIGRHCLVVARKVS